MTENKGYGWDSMPAIRRELYFRIIDGHPNLHAIGHRLHFLDEHFPPEKLQPALVWLVANNITGQVFINWFNQVCKQSDLEMHRLLISIVNNEAIGAVVAGKNFKQ